MQTYYNPLDLKDVLSCMSDWGRNGFDVSLSKFQVTIKRESSQYNKYMKWHIETIVDGRPLASEYCKTQPEAIRKLSEPTRPMPIGNRISFHVNELVGDPHPITGQGPR